MPDPYRHPMAALRPAGSGTEAGPRSLSRHAGPATGTRTTAAGMGGRGRCRLQDQTPYSGESS